MPSAANSVFGVVDATPSGPPSNTLTWPNCQIARWDGTIAPGVTALKDVLTEQVLPIDVEPVVTHGTVTGKFVAVPVAGSVPDGPFCLSVT
jgi:hypothetical protein